MALSQRYQPPQPPGQGVVYALDFSPLLPPGVGVTTPSVQIQTNTNPPGIATGVTTSGGGYRGRIVWITIQNMQAGTDYLISWTVQDTEGNQWVRTITLLCALTS